MSGNRFQIQCGLVDICTIQHTPDEFGDVSQTFGIASPGLFATGKVRQSSRITYDPWFQ